MVKFNKCLNRGAKIYGFDAGGVMSGVVGVLLGMIMFSVLIGGVIGAIFFLIGVRVSTNYYTGKIQKLWYIFLPAATSKTKIISSEQYFL